MPISRKRKLQLKEITLKAAEAKRRLRLDRETAAAAQSVLEQVPQDDCWDDELDSMISDISSSEESESEPEDNKDWGTDSDDDATLAVDESNHNITSSNKVELCWTDGAGADFRAGWGTGSERQNRCIRQHQRELEHAASQSYSITSMFERQRNLGLSIRSEEGPQSASLKDIERATPQISKSASLQQRNEEARLKALNDLTRFLGLKKGQEEKYGRVLSPRSNLYRRHIMVQSFLWIQQRKHEFPDSSRRGLARVVAKNNGKGGHTAQKIVQWEKSWVKTRAIPESKAGKHRHHISWMDDEEILLALRSFINRKGEG